MLRRDWTAAVAHHDGKPCRVCLRWPRQLAHVLPRQYDTLDAGGRRRRGTIRVHPLAVVPLCGEHHQLYDAHELDLEPHLYPEEIAHAAGVIGEGQALARIRGRTS